MTGVGIDDFDVIVAARVVPQWQQLGEKEDVQVQIFQGDWERGMDVS
jgi:hypothetical protein